jgi:hypothetical protein
MSGSVAARNDGTATAINPITVSSGKILMASLSAPLLPDENKDAGDNPHDIEKENGRAEIQAEPQKAIEDQIDCEQKHADVLCDFHDPQFTTKGTKITKQFFWFASGFSVRSACHAINTATAGL